MALIIKETLEQHKESIEMLKNSIEKQKEHAIKLESELLEKEKLLAISKQIINEAEKIKSQVSKIDICPLCKTKITSEHITELINKSESDIEKANKSIQASNQHMEKIKSELNYFVDFSTLN